MWNKIVFGICIIITGGCGYGKYQVVQMLEEDFFTNARIYHIEKVKGKEIEIVETTKYLEDGDYILFNIKKNEIKKPRK